MRWRNAGQLVMPNDFIPMAEALGLIVPLTEWAIREVCTQLSDGRGAGPPLVPVAINVLGRHLQRASLIEPPHAALTGNGIPAGLIELELTESVLMHNMATGQALLHSLKSLGVLLAIDDFGTGDSSLASLRRLPVDALKIDRGFVSELAAGSDSAAIVAAVLAIGRCLGLDVIAVGVETPAQPQLLHAEGCHLMQGFHLARPMPTEDFGRLRGRKSPPVEWRIPPASQEDSAEMAARRPSARPCIEDSA